MRKINILSLGLSQSNFLTQLYKEIKLRNNQFVFHVNNFRDLSTGAVEYDNDVFTSKFNFDEYKFATGTLLVTLLKLMFKSIFWRFFFFEMTQKKGIRKLIDFIKNEIHNKACLDEIIIPLKFDIYHFHFCVEKKLKLIHYLPKNASIICSFWGSDLYRNKDEYNFYYVKSALNKASYITIQTPEMGIDLFKTYGKELEEKTIFAQFAIETNIYKLIDKYQNESEILKDFKEEYKIPKDNFVLTIGYNAFKAFNHIDILGKINELDPEVKNKITCVLPLTYGRRQKYIDKLKGYITYLDLNIVCIDDFLTHEDVAKLRLITDIQIQMPISDALSGSVTEVIYAGNEVIAGSWLPYGIYKRNDIPITLVDNYTCLNTEITRLFKNKGKLGSSNLNIKSKIKDVFFPETTTPAWIDLYYKISRED